MMEFYMWDLLGWTISKVLHALRSPYTDGLGCYVEELYAFVGEQERELDGYFWDRRESIVDRVRMLDLPRRVLQDWDERLFCSTTFHRTWVIMQFDIETFHKVMNTDAESLLGKNGLQATS